MTYTSKKERGTSARSSLLTLIVVMLVGLFTVGCGDSGEDFVVTGNNGNAVPTGNVTFQFAKAQNIATVPTATTRLIFEFLDATGARTGNSADVPFANSVTLAVPTTATRAVVRAVDGTGATLATVSFTFTVLQNQTVIATVSGGGTTGTTTGNTTGTTTGNTTGSTTGNTTGSTTGNTTGSTTGNTTGSTTGNTTGGTAARLVMTQKNLFITPGGATAALQGVYFPANSTVGVSVGGGTANAFSATVASTNPVNTQATWTYNTAGNVVQASGGSPVVNAAENSSIVYNLTFTPASGQAASDTVTVTAVNGGDPRINGIQSARVASVNGASLKLPVGSSYPLGIVEVQGNGTVTTVAAGNIIAAPGPGTAGQYIVASSTGAVTYAGGTLTMAGIGTSNVTVTRNNANNNGPTSVGTIAVTVVDGTQFPAPVAGQFNTFLTLGGANNGATGSLLPYKVEIVFLDGTRQDITPVAPVTLAGAAGWVLNMTGPLFNGAVTVGTAASTTLSANGGPGIVGGNIPNKTPNTSAFALTRNP